MSVLIDLFFLVDLFFLIDFLLEAAHSLENCILFIANTFVGGTYVNRK